MYEILAELPTERNLADQVLDELIRLFEAHGQDCTCGVTGHTVVGFVEEDLLAKVTSLLLHYVTKVEIQTARDEEDELLPA